MNLQQMLAGSANTEDIKEYPLEKWHPQSCGDMDLVIQRDGTWVHEGRPMIRERLIALFMRLLICEEGEYYLITPVEKLRIQVEDRPLHIIEVDRNLDDDTLFVRLADGRRFMIGDQHPIKLSDVDAQNLDIPEVYIQYGLWARLTRNAYYSLIKLVDTQAGTLVSGGYEVKLY